MLYDKEIYKIKTVKGKFSLTKSSKIVNPKIRYHKRKYLLLRKIYLASILNNPRPLKSDLYLIANLIQVEEKKKHQLLHFVKPINKKS